jgi:hypothetical protein
MIRAVHPGSRIPNPEFLPVPHPGSSGQKGTGTRIPDPDPQHRYYLVYVSVPMLKNKNFTTGTGYVLLYTVEHHSNPQPWLK